MSKMHQINPRRLTKNEFNAQQANKNDNQASMDML